MTQLTPHWTVLDDTNITPTQDAIEASLYVRPDLKNLEGHHGEIVRHISAVTVQAVANRQTVKVVNELIKNPAALSYQICKELPTHELVSLEYLNQLRQKEQEKAHAIDMWDRTVGELQKAGDTITDLRTYVMRLSAEVSQLAETERQLVAYQETVKAIDAANINELGLTADQAIKDLVDALSKVSGINVVATLQDGHDRITAMALELHTLREQLVAMTIHRDQLLIPIVVPPPLKLAEFNLRVATKERDRYAQIIAEDFETSHKSAEREIASVNEKLAEAERALAASERNAEALCLTRNHFRDFIIEKHGQTELARLVATMPEPYTEAVGCAGLSILVNGKTFHTLRDSLSYSEVVTAAYGPVEDDDGITITFFRGRNPTEGGMTKGDTVSICNGMSFTAVRTNKA